MTDFTSYEIARSGDWSGPTDHCVLGYDDRFLRRKVLHTVGGKTLLVDLAQTLSVDHGDAFVLQDDGGLVEIVAADEPLLAITAPDLVQIAWHIGNRHTPCQIERTRLVIQNDPVIGHMLEHLGATVTPIFEPFTPEGGAYGHGRTHSHEHVHTAHGHEQGQTHNRAHDHGHQQRHSHDAGHSHSHDHPHSEAHTHTHSHAPGADPEHDP